jgi:hypothetical protein
MGWNDRLLEDPFVPSSDYYQERERYEAWLEYMTAQAMESERLTSQNINPTQLAKKPSQETPARQSFLSRIWAIIFGQEKSTRKSVRSAGKSISSGTTKVPF